jgi:hypothetical protein
MHGLRLLGVRRVSRVRGALFATAGGSLLAAALYACSSSSTSGPSGDAGMPDVDSAGAADTTGSSDGPGDDSQGDASPTDAPPDSTEDVDAHAALDANGGDALDAAPAEDGGRDATAEAGPSCALMTGLVGYWPFDEGTGTTTADVSGNGNAGTLENSPVWSASVPPTPYANKHSLLFDGVQSYVTMGNPAVLQLTGALSLTAWFESSATLGNYQTLVSKWWSGGTEAAYSIYWTDGNGPLFAVQNASLSTLGASSATPYTDGTWHFIAATWDGATARLYVDGKPVTATTPDASFGMLSNITDPFDVATDNRYAPGTGDRFFPGNVDDVHVYSRALSAAEVGALFNATCAAL